MPKNMGRNKRKKRPMSTAALPQSAQVHSVKDLLAHGLPSLKHVTAQAARQRFWHGWLGEHIPPQIRTRISGVAERDGTLVIFAESAAWSARLRYAVLELEREIRAADPELAAISVRVRPRSRLRASEPP
jgi:hypothetical protein